MRLIASQDAVAKARADIATANTEVLEELEENFKFRPDEKLLARSPMNRSMRASGRMTDATRALDDDLSIAPRKGEYHFYNLDLVYDNMLKHGVKPIVEL